MQSDLTAVAPSRAIAQTDLEQLADGESKLLTGVEGAWLIGDALRRIKLTLTHGSWLPFLESRGYGVRSAQTWMRLAGKPLPEVLGHASVNAALKSMAAPRLRRGHAAASGSHEVDDQWFTPAHIVEAARMALGGAIDIDPASCEQAQATVQAKRWHDRETDGLAHYWHGKCWLNPPYSAGPKRKYMAKLASELLHGRVSAAVLLLANDVSAHWFDPVRCLWSANCTIRGRLNFARPNDEDGSPSLGSTLYYFGRDPALFMEATGDLGEVLVPANTSIGRLILELQGHERALLDERDPAAWRLAFDVCKRNALSIQYAESLMTAYYLLAKHPDWLPKTQSSALLAEG